MKKLKLGKPRSKEEFLAIHRQRHEEEERMQKLAEAAQAFLAGGEKALKEFLESQQEKKSDDEQDQT